MEIIWIIPVILVTIGIIFVILTFVLALPLKVSLPSAGKTTINGITKFKEAVLVCENSGLTDWDLVSLVQNTVHKKMRFSRKNPLDSYKRAFERGFGNFYQESLALFKILYELNIDARIMTAKRVRLPAILCDGKKDAPVESSCYWVRVTIGDDSQDIFPSVLTEHEVVSKSRRVSGLSKPFIYLLGAWQSIFYFRKRK